MGLFEGPPPDTRKGAVWTPPAPRTWVHELCSEADAKQALMVLRCALYGDPCAESYCLEHVNMVGQGGAGDGGGRVVDVHISKDTQKKGVTVNVRVGESLGFSTDDTGFVTNVDPKGQMSNGGVMVGDRVVRGGGVALAVGAGFHDRFMSLLLEKQRACEDDLELEILQVNFVQSRMLPHANS